jgi:glycosyltransferase involved in cell wall biosynthesis
MGHDSHLHVGYRHLDEPAVSTIERVRVFPGLARLTRWAEQKRGWQNLYAPGFRQLPSIIDGDTDVVHVHSLWGAGNYADPGALPKLTRRFPLVMTLRDEWMLSGHCACTHDCMRWQSGCGRCPDLSIPPAIARDGTAFNWRRKRALVQKSHLHVTTVSDWLRQRVLKSPIFAGKPVSVVYNGIDTRVFKPGSRQSARAELGWPADRFLVLLAGQSVEGIRRGFAQQAAAAINGLKDSRILSVLVGHSAPAVAATLSRPCITMPFQKEPADMARCFQAADLTLVSSEVETFGRIAAESQACGTPVVTFASGGLPEVVKDGVGGIVIERFDMLAYAAAISALLEDRAWLEQMGQAAAAWASSRFANEVITHNYLDVYSQAIKARRRAA